MRYLFIPIIIVFIPVLAFTQTKSRNIVINFGFHQTNSSGVFDYYRSNEGGYVTKQSKATFFDLNVLVSKHSTMIQKVQGKSFNLTRLGLIYGLGVNQKGINQKGMSSDGTSKYYSYTAQIKRTYVSLYLGTFYDIIASKKIKISLGILFNPDFDVERIINKDSYFKQVALSSRSFLAVEYALTNKLGLRLSPYFQYGLSNYYEPLKNMGSTDYKPYGFGFNLGLVF